MGWIDSIRSATWWEDTVERAGKTFTQAYFAFWFVAPTVSESNAAMFDTLFTFNNVKAGVVGVALSLATSVGSSFVGDRRSASLVDA